MPAVKKIDEATFNVATARSAVKTTPVIRVLDGTKTEVSDDLRVLVPRNSYRWIVFVPDEFLGSIRWNRVFDRSGMPYGNVTVKNGVVFMVDPLEKMVEAYGCDKT